jgi:hypothetical protein
MTRRGYTQSSNLVTATGLHTAIDTATTVTGRNRMINFANGFNLRTGSLGYDA